MKLSEAKSLIIKIAELWPDQEVRLTLPVDFETMSMMNTIRDMGYFTHLEGSAHAETELVVKDKINENIGSAWSETSSS